MISHEHYDHCDLDAFAAYRDRTVPPFAGDTMFIPELAVIPRRLGHTSLALLPTDGLHIRPAGNRQVVMNADEAAEPTALLKPEVAGSSSERRPASTPTTASPRA
ncbi:hypothetical protein [Streptomyces sp. N50]|uniref:hypothetical protein n=1 Tax=Streptomyces sp. N50 TaxID=3081765 RepID=UPI002962515D|nr:hypothetical protein [Streptomyces sp. N50]WOX16336.1 hypothetical protein R2B38_46835 [Streptomyces sp. N50]